MTKRRATSSAPRVAGIAIGCAALSLAVLLGTVACQDGYPIPATQCDEWCEATRGLSCRSYDPTECVVQCAAAGGDAPECHGQWLDTIRCLQAPRQTTFDPCAIGFAAGYREEQSCKMEQAAYGLCALKQSGNNNGAFAGP